MRNLGPFEKAAAAYRRALALVANEPEQPLPRAPLTEVKGAAE